MSALVAFAWFCSGAIVGASAATVMVRYIIAYWRRG